MSDKARISELESEVQRLKAAVRSLSETVRRHAEFIAIQSSLADRIRSLQVGDSRPNNEVTQTPAKKKSSRKAADPSKLRKLG